MLKRFCAEFDAVAVSPSMMKMRSTLANSGFTLIELVMVLVLIGIMAALVAPRMGSVTGTKAAAFQDKLRADIRYAQNLAMTRSMRTRINFTVNSYSMESRATSTCGNSVAVIDPATGGPLSVALNAGDYSGITLTLPAMTCLEYDSLGQPYDCTVPPAPAACSTTLSGMIVGINSGAVATGSLTVSSRTGAVN